MVLGRYSVLIHTHSPKTFEMKSFCVRVLKPLTNDSVFYALNGTQAPSMLGTESTTELYTLVKVRLFYLF